MSDSVRPHRRQPTRLPHPWDSPGKNTGMGCHFLLQCMKVKRESEVAQSCPTLSDPMDCSPPGIFQARVLEWGAIAFSATSYMALNGLVWVHLTDSSFHVSYLLLYSTHVASDSAKIIFCCSEFITLFPQLLPNTPSSG